MWSRKEKNGFCLIIVTRPQASAIELEGRVDLERKGVAPIERWLMMNYTRNKLGSKMHLAADPCRNFKIYFVEVPRTSCNIAIPYSNYGPLPAIAGRAGSQKSEKSIQMST